MTCPLTREEFEACKKRYINPRPGPCRFSVKDDDMYRLLATVDAAIKFMDGDYERLAAKPLEIHL